MMFLLLDVCYLMFGYGDELCMIVFVDVLLLVGCGEIVVLIGLSGIGKLSLLCVLVGFEWL